MRKRFHLDGQTIWSNHSIWLNDGNVRTWNHRTSLINSGREMVNLDMYEYNMVVFTMFSGQIMPVMSSYDSESELELSTWIDAFFDFFFIDSRKSFTSTLGGTMSSEGKAISNYYVSGRERIKGVVPVKWCVQRPMINCDSFQKQKFGPRSKV